MEVNDEQVFLSRRLVLNGLFCSYGNCSVLLQLCVFSVIPSSLFIPATCTLLLLWEPGQLPPWLQVPVVLGLSRESQH